MSPPLPDGTLTSSEVLAKVYQELGPIHPPSYDQAALFDTLSQSRRR